MKAEPKTRAAPLTPFERLKALAQKVMAVPKTEIDKREKAWRKNRALSRKKK